MALGACICVKALWKRLSIPFPGSDRGKGDLTTQDSRWALVILPLHLAHSQAAYGTQLVIHMRGNRSLPLGIPRVCKVVAIV